MSERNEQIREPELEMEGQLDIFDLLADFFRGLKRIWWIILVLMCLCGGILYARSMLNYTPMYKSQSSFTVTTVSSSGASYSFYYDNSTAAQMASTFPYILESDLLTDLIKNDLGVSYINGNISASSVADANLFTLTVTSTNPQDAYDILQSVMTHYSEVSAYVIGDTKLNMIEAPKVADAPYNTRSGMDAGMKGAAGGFILGLIIVFIYGKMRKTIRKEEEIKDVLNVQCLGAIPKLSSKKHRVSAGQEISILNKNISSSFRESIHSIALQMDQEMAKKDHRVVLVTSTANGEGVTVFSKNLAYALAEMGKKVIYIDGHLERKSDKNAQSDKADKKAGRGKADKRGGNQALIQEQEKASGVAGKGFEALLRGKCSLTEAFSMDSQGKILTLSCKRGMSAKEILAMEGNIRILLAQLKKGMDYIIIDAPPCTNMSQVSIFAAGADAVVYMVKQDQEAAGRISDSIEDVSSYGATFAGCVLTQVEESGLAGYGYGKYGKYYGHYSYRRYGYGYGRRYGYGYGYGYGERERKEES